jgi:hypothetical protein
MLDRGGTAQVRDYAELITTAKFFIEQAQEKCSTIQRAYLHARFINPETR